MALAPFTKPTPEAIHRHQKCDRANVAGRLTLLLRQCTMESFFHTLKIELVHRERFATREAARRELFAYLEGYYNRQRLHSALGYRTPEQAERMAA